MRVAAERWPAGAVFVVGNAPTALAEVVRLAAAGRFAPALVIGLPVGFVGAAEAKAALRASGLPADLERGRAGRQRGGRRRPQRPVAGRPAPSRGAGAVTAADPVVHLVGAGPGDPLLLTRRAARLLARRRRGRRRPALARPVLALAPVAAERHYVGRTPGARAWAIDAVVDLLADRARAGGLVVRLKSGDPFVCSRGAEEVARPGRAGRPLPGHARGHRRHGRPARRRTGRGCDRHDRLRQSTTRPPPRCPGMPLADPAASLVVLTGRAQQGAIAAGLIAAGLPGDTPAAVVHAATRPGQRVAATTLDGLGRTRLPPPATLVVGPHPAAGKARTVHIPDGWVDLPTSAAAGAVAAGRHRGGGPAAPRPPCGTGPPRCRPSSPPTCWWRSSSWSRSGSGPAPT